MRFPVVCGLSETMASLAPTSRLRSVDLPAFGRPTSETKPAFTDRPSCRLARPGGARRRDFGADRGGSLGDAHAVDAPALGVEHFDAQPVDLEPLADGRHAADVVHQIAADRLESLALDLDAQP